MNPRLCQFAVDVIQNSGRDKPADGVLREKLKGIANLTPVDAAEISRAVFAYYRWRGWLSKERGPEARISRVLELAKRFEKSPFALPVASLRAKAVPGWIAEEVVAEDEWFRTLQREPKLWLRARPGQGRALAKKLGHARRLCLPEAVIYEGRQDLFQTPEFGAGEFEIQDLSSQAVGVICNPKPGETWWDVCAGEGGKTLHLADLMENRGLIWASDRAEWRLERLQRRAARAKTFNYRSVVWDGGPQLPTKTRFDGALVDAPCSGLGTWQRNPHARWTTGLKDVIELSAVQKQLLARAAEAVKPGGRLIYAVCTLTRSETVDVIDEFEKCRSDFVPLAMVNPLFPERPPSARIWLWPQHGKGNGMFVAQWMKSPLTANLPR